MNSPMPQIEKAYEPKEVEARWSRKWLEAKCFKAEVDPEKPSWAMMMPPPNVTGRLHMGHVLDNTLQDMLARRARLEGKSVLWHPGTDHAGIATQAKVEKQLRETTGETKHDLGREAFLGKVREFRESSGDVILTQLSKLGASCDWSRTGFTLDPQYSKAVLSAFVELYRRGRIYRGCRMVNWCPATQTAISDEEVDMRPSTGVFYKMRYELVEAEREQTHLEIATTRPETLMGDTAVAVHPEDERYQHLIGKKVWRPFPRAPIPVIGDPYVDREFGTGCLKVTPAHDKNDFEIGRRHGLEPIEVIGPDGHLTDLAGDEFAGMERFEARKAVARKLEAMGLLVESEPYENTVGFSERGHVPVEPRLSEQWFLKYPKVREARRAVEKDILQFHPPRWKKTCLHWLDGLQDWCISRQIWWGHRIPVWYRKGMPPHQLDFENEAHVHVSVEGPPDPENWEQEEDVLDTWASSWLWPMASLGWPVPNESQKAALDVWYPTATLVTGFDIIFFWVTRMIMAGLELYGEDRKELDDDEMARRIPFKHVVIHGLIRDDKGRKMSKSLGNSPDPLDLIDQFGADGLRFGICNIAPTGADILFSEERIRIGRNFCNKLWNAARFRRMSGPIPDNSTLGTIHARISQDKLDDYDHWILDRLADVTARIAECFGKYELAPITRHLYAFFWSDFCDWYVEISKSKLTAGTEEARDHCLAIQDLVLRQILQLAHPVIPHMTEELWKNLGYEATQPFIQNTRLPTAEQILGPLNPDRQAVRRVAQIQELVIQARALKAKYQLANKHDVSMFHRAEGEAAALIERHLVSIRKLAGLKALQPLLPSTDAVYPAVVTPLGPLYLDLGSSMDVPAERTRLSKALAELDKRVAAGQKKLDHAGFLQSAPEKVVQEARRQLAETIAKQDETARLLESLPPDDATATRPL